MLNRLIQTVSVPVLLSVAGCASPANSPNPALPVTIVCPEGSPDAGCDYTGLVGLQQAVDAADPGASIHMLAGTYTPSVYRDVPFQELVVRGALVIDGKQVSLSADAGAVMRGSREFPVSAIVIRASSVNITGLRISGFYYREAEDDIYDGHGIFTIDSQVALDSVRIEGIDKMALTGREAGHITAQKLIIEQSHLGVWLEETAVLEMSDSRIAGTMTAAVAAYGNARASVSSSTIDSSQDDGLYTEDNATIISQSSTVSNNVPFGARATHNSQIVICGGTLQGNTQDAGEENSGRVLINDPASCASTLLN